MTIPSTLPTPEGSAGSVLGLCVYPTYKEGLERIRKGSEETPEVSVDISQLFFLSKNKKAIPSSYEQVTTILWQHRFLP